MNPYSSSNYFSCQFQFVGISELRFSKHLKAFLSMFLAFAADGKVTNGPAASGTASSTE